jgi:DNA-binding PadR family transcriptional regulator
MSSIRLFILSSFADLGPMHGHRLRIEAEHEHVHLWTDISVGAVYGAMNRLASEGLLKTAGQEREGNRPTRQLYEITEAGRAALEALRREGLTEVWFKYDPFDLALTRMDQGSLTTLPTVLAARLERVSALLIKTRQVNADAREYVTLAEEWALRHSEYRLESEITYLSDLLAVVTDIVDDARCPRPRKLMAGRL